jgi:hypothetical protein
MRAKRMCPAMGCVLLMMVTALEGCTIPPPPPRASQEFIAEPPPPRGCFYTPYFSDTFGNFTQRCIASVVRHVRCRGDYCDDMALACCPEPKIQDPHTFRLSEWFSEEQPGGHICPLGGYLIGISCANDYCDDIQLTCKGTAALTNQCYWSAFFSEEQQEGGCRINEAAAGLRCEGDYCDNISLYCCVPKP